MRAQARRAARALACGERGGAILAVMMRSVALPFSSACVYFLVVAWMIAVMRFCCVFAALLL
ncbi:MAG: hypothetical protein V4793_18715 [Paraburkholderia tropica]